MYGPFDPYHKYTDDEAYEARRAIYATDCGDDLTATRRKLYVPIPSDNESES